MSLWNEITTLEQWNEVLQSSEQTPVLLLKHSTACPVSANALDEYESFIRKYPEQPSRYILVKVIESRPVSNQIASDLNVTHASPQIIWLKNRKQAWNASHWAVTVEHIHAVTS